MAVSVSCESCEYQFQVEGEHRGDRIRRPSCGDPIHVSGISSHDRLPTRLRSASRQRRFAARQAGRKSSVVFTSVAAGLIILGLIWFVLLPMLGSDPAIPEKNTTTEGP